MQAHSFAGVTYLNRDNARGAVGSLGGNYIFAAVLLLLGLFMLAMGLAG